MTPLITRPITRLITKPITRPITSIYLLILLISQLNELCLALSKTLETGRWKIHADISDQIDREGFLLECRPIIEFNLPPSLPPGKESRLDTDT